MIRAIFFLMMILPFSAPSSEDPFECMLDCLYGDALYTRAVCRTACLHAHGEARTACYEFCDDIYRNDVEVCARDCPYFIP